MKKKYLILIATIVVIVFLDQITKQAILQRFKLHETLIIIHDFFSLTYVRNPGSAFGFLNTAPEWFRVPFFILVPIIALTVIFYIIKTTDDKKTLLHFAYSLIVAGAIGNLIDRILYGYVIDFLLFYWKEGGPAFPAFNVADSAITVGVSLLIIDMILEGKKQNNASDSI
jgi:signal peptidase II